MYDRALGMRALRDPDAWERLARAVFDDASLPEPEPEPEPEPAAGPTPGLPGVAALLHWAYLDTAGSDMARDVANTALVSPDAGIAWLLPSGDDTGRLATAIETWRGWLAKVVTDTAPRSGYSEAEMARIRAGLASIALGEVPT
jgi:hypothetical protein